jgi:hypothetical protein
MKSRPASHGTAFFSQALATCLGRKGFTAAATLARIGVGYFKTAPGKTVAEIDYYAAQILRAEWIYQKGNTMHFAGEIVGAQLVKSHRVLHAGTSTLLNIEPQAFASTLSLSKHCFHVLSRTLGEVNYGITCHIGVHLKAEES